MNEEQQGEGLMCGPGDQSKSDVARIEDSHVTPAEAVRSLRAELAVEREITANLTWAIDRLNAESGAIGQQSAPYDTTTQPYDEPFRHEGANLLWRVRAHAGGIEPQLDTEIDAYLKDAAALPREPGTCKCGAAPVNKDGMCATCEDEQMAGVAEQSGAGAPETSVRCGAPAASWKAFHAMAWPMLWGIETTDPRAIDAGLEIVIAPCMPEHAAKRVAAIFNQQAPDFTHRETLLTLLQLLNPIHGSLDKQTYDEKVREEFEAPPDAEYSVNVTAQQERDLTQAVCILENRLRGTTHTSAVRGDAT